MSSSTEPLVSVIIPTYNRADLAMQAVASVRRQTYPNIQLIVVDDGSTDDTAVRLQSVPGITFIRQENQGQGAARNAGLALATGTYISTLDSDDLWHPEFLTESVAALEALQADFVFANWISQNSDKDIYPSYWEKYYRWWDFPRSTYPGWRVMEAQSSRDTYLDSCASPSSSLVLRRELIKHGWWRNLEIADDWCILLDIILNRPSLVAFTMKPLWTKRIYGDNIYDQRDHVEVKKILHLNDVSRMYKRFRPLLTKRERARFYGHFAFHRYGMVKIEARHLRLHAATFHLAHCLFNIGRGLTTSPRDAWTKALACRWKLRPAVTPPAEELRQEISLSANFQTEKL